MSNNNSNALKLLVIGSQKINFYDLFKNVSLKGRFDSVEVEQCAWDDLNICSYGADGIAVNIGPSYKPLPNTPQDHPRSFQPHFVLFRGSCRGDYSKDFTNQLLSFVHSGIPTLNSLDSFFISQDKALLYGKLLKVQRKLGKQEFPLVEQTFYASYKSAGFLPSFPTVVKIGTASGGLGKMKIVDQTAWNDFVSVAAMQSSYFTSEPFIEWDIDIRIQKIGNHYRCFARKSASWKSNTGMMTEDSDIPVEIRYQKWIDAAAEELDMDICAMDVVRSKSDGKEYILEINPSSIGLNPKYQDEDAIHIRDLTVKKMEEAYPKEKSKKKGLFG